MSTATLPPRRISRRTLSRKLRSEIEPIVTTVMRKSASRIERLTVVKVYVPEGEYTGGTCDCVDGLANTSFGIRWYENRPKIGDVVLVEFPPPSGTRRVIAICREVASGSGSAITSAATPRSLSTGDVAGDAIPAATVGAIVHVADYGAVGDGATDDTAAIQEAIDAVSANGGGTVVCTSGGIHLTTGPLQISVSDVILDENGATIRRMSGSGATNDPVVQVLTPEGSTDPISRSGVRGGALDGNGVARMALEVTSVAGARVQQVQLFGGTEWQFVSDCYDDSPDTTGMIASGITVVATGSAGGVKLDGSPSADANTVGANLDGIEITVVDGDAIYFGAADTNNVDLIITDVTGSGRGIVFAGSDTEGGNARNNHILHASPGGGVHSLAADFPATGNRVTLNSGSAAPVVEEGSDLSWISDHVGVLSVTELPDLPNAAYPPGKAVVFLSEDDPPFEGGKLYRNVLDVWTAAVPAVDIEDLTSDLIEPDGVAPASSPAPTVQAGIGSLVAKWTPVDNHDLVIYEVHVSAANGFTPGPTTLYAETPGASIVIRKQADGSAFAALTTYYVKLIAKDADGSAAAGAQGSAQVAQAGTDDIAANAVTAAKVATDTLTANEIAAGAISTSELAAGAVTAAKITAGTITSNEIAALTIVAANIAAATITGGKIAAGTITASNIATDTITANEIAAGTITAAEIAANTITTAKLAVTAAVGYVDNSIGGAITYGVTIDPTGITIKDKGGTSVLTGAGFGGSWINYVSSRIYNSSFDAGPTNGNGTVITTGSDAATTLPGWTLIVVGGTRSEISWRNDASVGRFGQVRLKLLNAGNAADESYIYQDVPIAQTNNLTSGVHAFEVDGFATSVPAGASVFIRARYLDASHTGIGTESTFGDNATVPKLVYPNNGAVMTNAAYVRVKVGIKRGSAATSATAQAEIYSTSFRFQPLNIFFGIGGGMGMIGSGLVGGMSAGTMWVGAYDDTNAIYGSSGIGISLSGTPRVTVVGASEFTSAAVFDSTVDIAGATTMTGTYTMNDGSALAVNRTSGNAFVGSMFNTTNTTPSVLILRKSGNATLGSLATAVQVGENLGNVASQGVVNSAYETATQIVFQADANGTVSSGRVDGLISFQTANAGTTRSVWEINTSGQLVSQGIGGIRMGGTNLNMESGDIVLTTTGTKIGTGATQKMSFWGAAVVAQAGLAPTGKGLTAAGTGTTLHADSTFAGGLGGNAYTVGDIVFALKTVGLLP